jgi:hypothetical protein
VHARESQATTAEAAGETPADDSGMPEVPTRALVLLGAVLLVGAVSVGVIPEP